MANNEFVTFTQEVTVKINPAILAKMFCAMTDDQMAEVFIECEKIGQEWEIERAKKQRRTLWVGLTGMFFEVGRHLQTCECSNEGVRNLIEELHAGMTYQPIPLVNETQC